MPRRRLFKVLRERWHLLVLSITQHALCAERVELIALLLLQLHAQLLLHPYWMVACLMAMQ